MSRLHVDSVIKQFDARQVLTDVFISCQKGEIIGLLGRNGSGKSTLLKIIFGSMQADRKFVKVGDKIINGLFDNRHLIKYLPHDSFLPNHIKIKTIIDLFCSDTNAGLVKNHALMRPLLSKKSKQVSAGEKRLLEILIIIFSDSEFTLIDEPFSGLSPLWKEDIKTALLTQSREKGFIITDHDYRNIMDIATRIMIIHDGGTKEITSENELAEWGYSRDAE